MKLFWFIGFILFGFSVNSQEKDTLKMKISGFLESYYSYDFSNSNTDVKFPFMYNYNRHNEFNLNNGLIRTQLEYGNSYASIAFHTGLMFRIIMHQKILNLSVKHLWECI